jgi:hypothetical protein
MKERTAILEALLLISAVRVIPSDDDTLLSTSCAMIPHFPSFSYSLSHSLLFHLSLPIPPLPTPHLPPPLSPSSLCRWSLGALCYEMLSGKPPFSAKTQKELDRKILSEKITCPSYLTASAHSLLKGMLEKDL